MVIIWPVVELDKGDEIKDTASEISSTETNKVFNFYIVDPYNEMEKFQRVRIRKLILNLKNQGLNFEKLIITLNNLASSNKALREIVENNISKIQEKQLGYL